MDTSTRFIELEEEFLAKNQECLKLVRQACQMNQCRFPVDLSRGVEAEVDHLPPLRGLARLMVLDATLHADTGRVEDTYRSLLDLANLGRVLKDEPTLISQLVRIAIHSMAVDAIERALHRVQFEDDQLAALAQALHKEEDPDMLLPLIKIQKPKILFV